MTYDLTLGNPAYSSWSLRAWLLFDAFDLPMQLKWVEFAHENTAEQLAQLSPARTVPVLKTEGQVIWDSLAITEELASRHPESGIWPSAPNMRALARSLCAEMHSSFPALRGECPMNLRIAYHDVPVGTDLANDLARLEALLTHALGQSGGPWLCGAFSAVDAFYAPVVIRLIGYDLVPDALVGYCAQMMAHPSIIRWQALAENQGESLARYTQPHPQRPWPA